MEEFPGDKLDNSPLKPYERSVVTPCQRIPRVGNLIEVQSAITVCERRQKGRFYTPYQPQTRVLSCPLPDKPLAEIVRVILLVEDFYKPGVWWEAAVGQDLAWAAYLRYGEEDAQVGGKVARVIAAYFYNQSDTTNRNAAINVIYRLKATV